MGAQGSALPARPRVTIAYRQTAYGFEEIASAGALLETAADFEAEPMALHLMGGVSELLITIAFAEPIVQGRHASAAVLEALGEVCTILADWYAQLVRNRPTEPELIAVRVAGRDVRVDVTSDLSPDAALDTRELRAVPRVLREVGPRLAELLDEQPARIICLGVHNDPGTGGGGHCVIGRYWEVCEHEDEPTMIVDSWRERIYLRR